jgi:hypothetical protein
MTSALQAAGVAKTPEYLQVAVSLTLTSLDSLQQTMWTDVSLLRFACEH